jgi:hypothetical protein
MRKVGMLTLVLALFSLATQAQTGKISLKVEDNEKKKLESVTATLLRAKDSGVVKTELSDKEGLVQFLRLNEGKYFIVLSSSGFAKTTTPAVDLTLIKMIRIWGPLKC